MTEPSPGPEESVLCAPCKRDLNFSNVGPAVWSPPWAPPSPETTGNAGGCSPTGNAPAPPSRSPHSHYKPPAPRVRPMTSHVTHAGMRCSPSGRRGRHHIFTCRRRRTRSPQYPRLLFFSAGGAVTPRLSAASRVLVRSELCFRCEGHGQDGAACAGFSAHQGELGVLGRIPVLGSAGAPACPTLRSPGLPTPTPRVRP